MKKFYPYLEDTTNDNINDLFAKSDFLSSISSFVNQKQYVRITLLDWAENPLEEISGEISSGSITKDGTSAVRRTCSMSLSVDSGSYDMDDMRSKFSINKKIYVEVGVKNYSNKYSEYPILWFPQGVFFISSASMQSSATAAIQIQLRLKDKMCCLNGDIGGNFPATTILDERDTQNAQGDYVTQKVRVYDIIQEVVHHYGGEPLDNIVIEDVPTRIRKVVKWMGDKPLWLRKVGDSDGSGYFWYDSSIDNHKDDLDWIQFQANSDIGYVYDDFVYTSDLTCNIGDTVTTALDKIKQYLGNYEYFYDVYGTFHFRERKNYLNTTLAKTVMEDMDEKDYLVDSTVGKSEYTFTDKTNIVSLTNSPKYENIKNDYIVQGHRAGTSSNKSVAIRYHLVIDKKPKAGNSYYNLVLYREESSNVIRPAFPQNVSTKDDLPTVGNFNLIYRVADTNSFLYWSDDSYKDVDVVAYYPRERFLKDEGSVNVVYGGYTTKDWRTELYLQGLLGRNLGTDQSRYYANMQYDGFYSDDSWLGDIYRQSRLNRVDVDYYFEELDAFWPQMYDLQTQQFVNQESDRSLLHTTLIDGNYFLDFIDPQSSGIGEYSVQNIGRRQDIIDSDDINCLFTPTIPDIIWLSIDDDDIESKRRECDDNGQPYSQLRGELFQHLYVGGYKNGAFDAIKTELWSHTTYQKSISISAIPVFYLEPNSRVTINDTTTNTHGDYEISTITVPLGGDGLMSVSGNECIQKM